MGAAVTGHLQDTAKAQGQGTAILSCVSLPGPSSQNCAGVQRWAKAGALQPRAPSPPECSLQKDPPTARPFLVSRMILSSQDTNLKGFLGIRVTRQPIWPH